MSVELNKKLLSAITNECADYNMPLQQNISNDCNKKEVAVTKDPVKTGTTSMSILSSNLRV